VKTKEPLMKRSTVVCWGLLIGMFSCSTVISGCSKDGNGYKNKIHHYENKLISIASSDDGAQSAASELKIINKLNVILDPYEKQKFFKSIPYSLTSLRYLYLRNSEMLGMKQSDNINWGNYFNLSTYKPLILGTPTEKERERITSKYPIITSVNKCVKSGEFTLCEGSQDGEIPRAIIIYRDAHSTLINVSHYYLGIHSIRVFSIGTPNSNNIPLDIFVTNNNGVQHLYIIDKHSLSVLSSLKIWLTNNEINKLGLPKRVGHKHSNHGTFIFETKSGKLLYAVTERKWLSTKPFIFGSGEPADSLQKAVIRKSYDVKRFNDNGVYDLDFWHQEEKIKYINQNAIVHIIKRKTSKVTFDDLLSISRGSAQNYLESVDKFNLYYNWYDLVGVVGHSKFGNSTGFVISYLSGRPINFLYNTGIYTSVNLNDAKDKKTIKEDMDYFRLLISQPNAAVDTIVNSEPFKGCVPSYDWGSLNSISQEYNNYTVQKNKCSNFRYDKNSIISGVAIIRHSIDRSSTTNYYYAARMMGNIMNLIVIDAGNNPLPDRMTELPANVTLARDGSMAVSHINYYDGSPLNSTTTKVDVYKLLSKNEIGRLSACQDEKTESIGFDNQYSDFVDSSFKKDWDVCRKVVKTKDIKNRHLISYVEDKG
jgi:hypothetical protein